MSKFGTHKNLASRLLSGGIWVLFGQATLAVSGLAINAVLARLLLPEEFGAYFLALSISVVGALVAQCGTQLSIVQQVAGALAKGREGEVRLLLRSSGVLVTAGLIIVESAYLSGAGAWLGEKVFHSPFVTGFTVLIGFWIALRVIQTFLSQIFRGFHNLKLGALFDGALSSLLLFLMLLGAWIFYGKTSFRNVLELTILAFTISVVFGSILLRRHWYSLPYAKGLQLRPVVRVAFPLFVTGVALLGISELHLWILGAASSEQQVALYGAAYRLVLLVAMPLTLVGNVITPTVTELFAKRDLARLERVMRTTATAATVLALVVAIPLVIAANQILNVFYGNFYTNGSNALIIMTLAQLVNVFTGSPGVLLAMSDRQGALMRIGLLSGFIGLIVSFLLASQYGATGVALGFAAGMIAHNVTMSIYCRVSLGVRTYWTPRLLPELVSRLRAELSVRANLSGFWFGVEQVLRPVENIFCRLTGTQIIECLGDSHVNIFSMLNRKRCLSRWHFRVTVVRGATAFGLANPNSRTNAFKIFSGWLDKMSSDSIVLFMLGEVDVGYLIWVRSKQTGEDPYYLLDQALSRYFGFLEQRTGRFRKLVLVSVPLPAVGDNHSDEAMLDLRKGLTSSQRERTDLTLEYNRRLGIWARGKGAYFIDMDDLLLDPRTRLLKRKYVQTSVIDHHYEQDAFSDLLCTLISDRKFNDWVKVYRAPN